MKALKMALALALVAFSPVVASTSAMANVAAEEVVDSGDGGGGHYMCYYRYSFISNGVQYNVYQCYPILA
jgi:hypothetical protein